MDRKNILPVVVVIGIIAFIAIVLMMWWPTLYQGETPRPTPTITGTTFTPDPETTPDQASGNITITNVAEGDALGLPAVIEGEARVFESTMQVRVRDSNGTVLVERTVMADALDAGEFGPYRAELYYPEPIGQTGTVEAFQYSARDGSEVDTVTIPVTFLEVATIEVEVYYSNRQEDPDAGNCEITYPVERRIPKTQAVGRAALAQLLLGPSRGEGDKGFFTNIPSDVQVNSLTIENGTATVDFNESLRENVAGSCLVQAIRSQITNTLTQFDTVDDVVISINGDTQDVLQP